MSYNVHEIDLTTAHSRKALELGMAATRIRVLHHGGDLDLSLAPGAPLLPVTHVGQLFRPGCEGGKRVGVTQIFYTNSAGSGTVDLLVSDDETDVDFDAASSGNGALEIVLACIVPRALSGSLDTKDPKWDNADPLGAGAVSGDGTAATAYDATNEIFGARYQIPAGATAYSHAGAKITQYSLPLAQLLNTQGHTHRRGRDWYVETADTIYTTYTGTNIIRRGFGFGEINETVGGWQKPFLGVFADRGWASWRLWARDNVDTKLNPGIPLVNYSPEEIQAVAVRVGQENTIPYVEAHFNGALAHREVLPLGTDLEQMGVFPMNPWVGCARALAADAVEVWGLLDGAWTVKLVYPDG